MRPRLPRVATSRPANRLPKMGQRAIMSTKTLSREGDAFSTASAFAAVTKSTESRGKTATGSASSVTDTATSASIAPMRLPSFTLKTGVKVTKGYGGRAEVTKKCRPLTRSCDILNLATVSSSRSTSLKRGTPNSSRETPGAQHETLVRRPPSTSRDSMRKAGALTNSHNTTWKAGARPTSRSTTWKTGARTSSRGTTWRVKAGTTGRDTSSFLCRETTSSGRNTLKGGRLISSRHNTLKDWRVMSSCHGTLRDGTLMSSLVATLRDGRFMSSRHSTFKSGTYMSSLGVDTLKVGTSLGNQVGMSSTGLPPCGRAIPFKGERNKEKGRGRRKTNWIPTGGPREQRRRSDLILTRSPWGAKEKKRL
ncbi:hypothetical protein IWZ00DRAFT_108676 [Phyllosticta capitalensis]